ncbi:acyl-homoserine-lactone synthase [Paremcibacter congregatus]|uniref:acyl-homoserine-lactone synthase n=1 Tax=Paremcibacter congregatus TaxID=2043170 RepID=UPI0030EE76E7|tara:strand:+ start:105 stop:731 length:627 start_codon:yes stop_codon:yes gene_type:complete
MIYLINHENRHLFANLLKQMFQHRNEIFINRLKWDLTADNGLEKDQFDTEDAMYLILVDDTTGDLRSSLRLIPTIKPHLMSDLFSSLCEKGVPRGEGVWEISRYCCNPSLKSRQENIKAIQEIMCGIFECALIYGWEKLTLVVGMPLLQHCLRAAWDISPLGLPQKDKSTNICAFEVAVTPAGLQALRHAAGNFNPALKILPQKQLAA